MLVFTTKPSKSPALARHWCQKNCNSVGCIDKKILEVPVPKALLCTCLEKDEIACLSWGNCVIVCPVNSLNNIELAAEYLNDMDVKSLIEVKNGRISILNQDLCGADGACALICTVNAIKLAKRKVKWMTRTTAIKNGYILDLFNEIKGKIMYIFIKYRIAVKALHIPN